MNIIAKKRTVPWNLRSLESLLRRLEEGHPKQSAIAADIGKRQAGFTGEQNLDYFLSFLPKGTRYFIHHDLRLKARFAFQLDTLILTPYYALVLEVKYMPGRLKLDGQGQLHRLKQQQRDLFASPIDQTWRQQVQLEQLLSRTGSPLLPIYSYVVFTSPYSELDLTDVPAQAAERMIRVESLHKKVEALNQTNAHRFATDSQLESLSKLLIEMNTPQIKSPLPAYQIDPAEIHTGIYCPSCSTFSVSQEYYRKIWQCKKCSTKGVDLFIDALRDYALLHSPNIQLNAAKEFLHISNSNKMYSLLRKCAGKPKGRTYSLLPLFD